MPRGPTWRYSTGTKGVNRVTVYERRDREILYIEYKDGYSRRVQRAVETEIGKPLPNTEEGRRLAVLVAEAVSKDREQALYRETAEAYGARPMRTVAELLDKLHADRESGWSETYQRDQKRFREFWKARLGSLTLIRTNAALVNDVAARQAKAKKWAPRTHGSYLRYLIDAFSYAERKLKWIEARDNLSAVDIPSPQSTSEAYTLAEVRVLLPALEGIDRRAGWIGHVAWQTGRRLTSIRTLRKRDVLSADGRAVLRFRAERDKARKPGEAVVVGRAAELTAKLMAGSGSYVLGRKPPTLDQCQAWIEAAETSADVKHVNRRAWHGLKRAFATLASDLRLASKQSGTHRATLERVYDKDWLDGKEGLASAMEAKLSVPEVVPEAKKRKKRGGRK